LNLFEALHMRFGFIEMSHKALLELLIRCLFGHFRQRLHELLLGIIDVLQLMQEQIVHGLDVFGEKSHWPGPLLGGQNSAGVSGCWYQR
jgi:hypothetical protein